MHAERSEFLAVLDRAGNVVVLRIVPVRNHQRLVAVTEPAKHVSILKLKLDEDLFKSNNELCTSSVMCGTSNIFEKEKLYVDVDG